MSGQTAGPTPDQILQRLDWEVIRRLDGLLQGDYRTLFYGGGLDFADLREYQPQDDSRHIDWNVTARMNSPYVRQFVEDREITAWFVLDLSPSMAFGPAQRPKQMVVAEFVATLARLLTRSGNRVGGLVYSTAMEAPLPPRGGRNQVLRLIKSVLQPRPAVNGRETDLTTLLQRAHNSIRRRSLIFLVSDFLSLPGWERPLNLLSRRHELVSIRLWDPREMELPDAGLLVVEDAETGEQLTVDTSLPAFRRRFYDAAQERELQLAEQLRKAGVDLFGLSTEDDLVESIIRLARLRKQRRRVARPVQRR